MCSSVLLFGGNHKEIALWKFENSLMRTKKRRPDLFERFVESVTKLTKEEQKILDKYTK